MRLDPATGLYHTPNREYSPSSGRWTQQDPVHYADSMNLYQFVLANPLTNTDPEGTLTQPNATKIVEALSRLQGDAPTVLGGKAADAREVFRRLSGGTYAKAAGDMGKNVIFAPLNAIPSGVFQKVGIEAMETLFDAALNGQVDGDKIADILRKHAVNLAPEELRKLADALSAAAANVGKGEVAKKLYGPGRFVTVSYDSPFNNDVGFHIKGQFYVSAETKNNGVAMSENWGKWTVIGTVQFCYNEGVPAPRWDGPKKGTFNVNASGGKSDFHSEIPEYDIDYTGFSW